MTAKIYRSQFKSDGQWVRVSMMIENNSVDLIHLEDGISVRWVLSDGTIDMIYDIK